MGLKSSGPSEEIDRFGGGIGWIAHPGEAMERASHCIGSGDGVWIVDPVDAGEVDDLIAEFGDVRGVVVLLARHTRDAAAIARRQNVPVCLPSFVNATVPANTDEISGRLPDSTFEVHKIVDWAGWREAALYDGETLIVPEALGTSAYFLAGQERIGVHPMLRLTPPKALRKFSPTRILTGHGRGVMEDADDALQYALDGARRRAPKTWFNGLTSMF